MTIDIRVLDDEGREAATLGGLTLKRLAPEDLRPAHADAIKSWLYQMSWVPRPALAPASTDKDSRSRWLVFADQQGVAVGVGQTARRPRSKMPDGLPGLVAGGE